MVSKKNKDRQILYEEFHSVTKKQHSIITTNDYTHGPLIKILNRYTTIKDTFLNIGCGTGSIDFYLAKKGNKIIGIDISERAIKACQENAKKFGLDKQTTFVKSTFENFQPIKNFDVVLCIEVIEHLKDDYETLIKINKLLNRSGILVLSTPSKNAPLFKIGFLSSFDKRVGHLRRYTSKSLTKLLKKSGFHIVKMKKTEGIVRNFLFTSTLGGKILLRLVNRFEMIKKFVLVLDKLSLKFFSESDLIVICKKV